MRDAFEALPVRLELSVCCVYVGCGFNIFPISSCDVALCCIGHAVASLKRWLKGNIHPPQASGGNVFWWQVIFQNGCVNSGVLQGSFSPVEKKQRACALPPQLSTDLFR